MGGPRSSSRTVCPLCEMPTVLWSSRTGRSPKPAATASYCLRRGTTRRWWRGRREGSWENRSGRRSSFRRGSGLLHVEWRERRDVSQPEPSQPTLLIDLDEKVVGGPHPFHRPARSDLQVKDAFVAVG